jgi:hypothetical protein
MRALGAVLVIVALGLSIYALSTFIPSKGGANQNSPRSADGTTVPKESQTKFARLGGGATTSTGPFHHPVPVALNRSAEILDGFRGEVHPLLFGKTRLEVSAEWSPVGKGRGQIERHLKPHVYSWFTDLQPAQKRHTYTERDFSAFLPNAVSDVGQLWALDADKVVGFLKQFHPRPSAHLIAPGRRTGPDGAFAILRAVSPNYLDILFRIHAEFFLTPDDWPSHIQPVGAWYTPAYFVGRVLVNQKTGTVDQFRLALATDKALNVHLTVDASGMGFVQMPHDVVRVDRMELTGGNGELLEKISWTKAVTPVEAERRLAKIFYKSLEIDFVPLDQALALARRLDRPIFAIVSWGSFEDQSC